MITLNPKKFFLNNVKQVEICLENNGEITTYLMMKDEKGVFKYENDKDIPYTNYYFKIDGKNYCSHKLEYVVISTMSSGKSTFINSLVGDEIMPSENQACTGKIFKLENSLGNQKDSMYIKKNGKLKRYYLDKEILRELNSDSQIDEIGVQTKYFNMKNNITIYDTPGINNFQDHLHKEITYNFLEKAKIKNIIYIINATQIGTNDDKLFLLDIEELKQKKDMKIMFILNKIDSLDEKNENKENVIENVKKYLKKNKFENYSIFPLSAYCAKLVRKALKNNIETRKEKLDLTTYYNLSLISESFENDEHIIIKNSTFSKKKLEQMLEESGILAIEKAMQNINEFYPTFSLKIM